MKMTSVHLIAAVGLGLILAGCAKRTMVFVDAERPDGDAGFGLPRNSGITRFEISDDRVHVYSTQRALRSGKRQELEELDVFVGARFHSTGFNQDNAWTLTHLAGRHAVFDVTTRFYGCTDPFAIIFGIPSSRRAYRVVVCGQAPTHGPHEAE